MRRAQLFVIAIVVAFSPTSSAVNFKQCLNSINNMTIDGKRDIHGNHLPPSTSNATAITYDLCASQCGTGQEPFQWIVFSQQFCSWLVPWLTLVPHLPFGANDKINNLESMLLTLGSPTLAAYSLALTVLNTRWITQLFSKYRYPNVQKAVRILSSLQQSPLRVDKDDAYLASLIMLPQNDEWWAELVVWLEFPLTWSIAAATSAIWVIFVYIFTIVHYFTQDAPDALNSNGDGVGSIGPLWLWLLPIVVGWLQLSPKCDSIRLHQAVDRANSVAYFANQTSQPIKGEYFSKRRAIYIARSELDKARLDELSTPPIYNYARFLPWVQAVTVVSNAFGIICEREHHHDPVDLGTGWQDRNLNFSLTASQVEYYSTPRPGSVYHLRDKWGLDGSTLFRMFIASAVALTLQWGTTAGAITIVWFTSAFGLGCRSVSYLIYGALSTLVWMMLLTSSILTYYSTNNSDHFQGDVILTLQARVARWFSIFLRRLGKVIAVLNAGWIVATGLFQFSNFYNRCYCDSNIMAVGRDAAYVIISLASEDMGSILAAQIGGFFLAAGAAMIFALFVRLVITPPIPS